MSVGLLVAGLLLSGCDEAKPTSATVPEDSKDSELNNDILDAERRLAESLRAYPRREWNEAFALSNQVDPHLGQILKQEHRLGQLYLRASTPFLATRISATAHSSTVVACALTALGPRSEQELRARFLALSKSRDHGVRDASIIALGNLKDPTLLSSLRDLLEREQIASTKGLIINAIVQLRTEAAFDIALPYLDHCSETLRNAAAKALADSRVETVRRHLKLHTNLSRLEWKPHSRTYHLREKR